MSNRLGASLDCHRVRCILAEGWREPGEAFTGEISLPTSSPRSTTKSSLSSKRYPCQGYGEAVLVQPLAKVGLEQGLRGHGPAATEGDGENLVVLVSREGVVLVHHHLYAVVQHKLGVDVLQVHPIVHLGTEQCHLPVVPERERLRHLHLPGVLRVLGEQLPRRVGAHRHGERSVSIGHDEQQLEQGSGTWLQLELPVVLVNEQKGKLLDRVGAGDGAQHRRLVGDLHQPAVPERDAG